MKLYYKFSTPDFEHIELFMDCASKPIKDEILAANVISQHACDLSPYVQVLTFDLKYQPTNIASSAYKAFTAFPAARAVKTAAK